MKCILFYNVIHSYIASFGTTICFQAAYDPENVRCIVDVLMKSRDESEKCAITDDDVRAIFIDLLVSGRVLHCKVNAGKWVIWES